MQRLQGVVEDLRTAEPAWPIKGLIKHFRPRMERRIADAKGDEMLEAAE